MRTLIHNAATKTDLCIALLTGTYSQPEDFLREGFPQAVEARGIAAEIVMGEVRAAWFAEGSIVERIHDHVVRPARARGHSRIWLAGISLGALASLCYAARHEADIEGVVLISPYPATREVLLEMEAAGGLASWKPVIPPQGDLEREAWMWLGGRSAASPRVHCCFASGDRFAAGQRLMAQALSPEHVLEVPGGHDWPAWRRLWGEFLAREPLLLAARYDPRPS